ADDSAHDGSLQVEGGWAGAGAGWPGTGCGNAGSSSSTGARYRPSSSGRREPSQRAPSSNPGSRRDSRHHGSRENGVNPSRNTTRTTSASPRARPNTMPSRRSLPDRPLPSTSLRMMNVMIAPATSTAMKHNAYATSTRADGVDMLSESRSARAGPSSQASQNAHAHTARASTSTTKPRHSPISTDRASTAMMV